MHEDVCVYVCSVCDIFGYTLNRYNQIHLVVYVMYSVIPMFVYFNGMALVRVCMYVWYLCDMYVRMYSVCVFPWKGMCACMYVCVYVRMAPM